MQNMAMNMMKDAIGDMPKPMRAMDMTIMQECLEALSACMQSATMCADMDAMNGSGTCASQCANCADMCLVMMRMMLRMNSWNTSVMAQAMECTATVMRSCAASCKTQCDDEEHCRTCAAACEHGAAMLDTMIASMPAMA